MFKASNKNIGRRQWRRSGGFFVNFQPVSHLFQVFQLTCMLTGKVLKYVNVPVVQEMI